MFMLALPPSGKLRLPSRPPCLCTCLLSLLWELATKNGLRAGCPRLPTTSEFEFYALPQRRRQPELVFRRTVTVAGLVHAGTGRLIDSLSDMTKPRFHRIVLVDVPTVMSVLMKVAWKRRLQPAEDRTGAEGHSTCAAPEDEGEALLRTTRPARLAEPWAELQTFCGITAECEDAKLRSALNDLCVNEESPLSNLGLAEAESAKL